MTDSELFSINFNIDAWQFWTPEIYFGSSCYVEPDLHSVNIMQRRRLPQYARQMFNFVDAGKVGKLPIIYASKYGEIQQTLELIAELEQISPTKFSLSVHNAVAGMLSIVQHNTNAYLALDSMHGCLEAALCSAWAQLQLVKDEQITVVYYEQQTPEVLQQMSQQPIASSKTMQLFMLRIAKGNNYKLVKFKSTSATINDGFDGNLQLAGALAAAENIEINHGAYSWKWLTQNAEV